MKATKLAILRCYSGQLALSLIVMNTGHRELMLQVHDDVNVPASVKLTNCRIGVWLTVSNQAMTMHVVSYSVATHAISSVHL